MYADDTSFCAMRSDSCRRLFVAQPEGDWCVEQMTCFTMCLYAAKMKCRKKSRGSTHEVMLCLFCVVRRSKSIHLSRLYTMHIYIRSWALYMHDMCIRRSGGHIIYWLLRVALCGQPEIQPFTFVQNIAINPKIIGMRFSLHASIYSERRYTVINVHAWILHDASCIISDAILIISLNDI